MIEPAQRDTLLGVAAASIRHGLQHGEPLIPEARDFPAPLQRPGASFVTLTQDGRLRGCIGSLQALRPLVKDVAANAFAAAFSDPRFPALSAAEYPGLTLAISVLSPAEPMHFSSEADLIAQLRPGIDGLILEDGAGHRGTFLPSVWETLPQPTEFLRQLKIKAGLPPDYWSDSLRVHRYHTESFARPVRDIPA